MTKNYHAKMDMHVHSIASDGISNYKTILKVAKKKNLGISISDHNHVSQSIKAAKNKIGITAVPGIEVTSKEGAHILFYFYSASDLKIFFNKYIKPNFNRVSTSNLKISVHDLIYYAKKFNGIPVAAHPISPGLTGAYLGFKNDNFFIKNISAIEAMNSCCLESMNRKSINWGKKIKKPMIAGSDAHYVDLIGTSFTLLKSNNSISDVLNSIKKGHCRFQGRTYTPFERIEDILIKTRVWLSHPGYFFQKFIIDLKKARMLYKS